MAVDVTPDSRLQRPNSSRVKVARQVLVKEVRFADDMTLIAGSVGDLTSDVQALGSVSKKDGNLAVSIKKTKVMTTVPEEDVPTGSKVELDNTELERVANFIYLGSGVDASGSVSKEVRRRIVLARAAFDSLRKVLWKRREVSVKTKMRVFRATVLTRLLYGSETWALTAVDLHRLESFQTYCLRRILRISWRDFVTNETVRQRCHQPVLEEVLRQRRMRWLGHVQRMGPERLPRRRLAVGKRPPGGQRMRWKDVCTKDLRSAGAEGTWTERCTDRHSWQRLFVPETLVTKREIDRYARKQKCNYTEPGAQGGGYRTGADVVAAATVARGKRRRATAAERAEHHLVSCSRRGCERKFARPQDEKRHKCVTTRWRR